MNLFKLKSILYRLKSIRLTQAERADLRSQFLMQTGLTDKAPSYFASMFPQYVLSAAFGIAALLVGITPLAIAARDSVPGDLLYSVKVIVNEPVQNVISKITNKDRKQEEGPGKKTLDGTRDAQLTEGVQKTLQNQASDTKSSHNDENSIKKSDPNLPDVERTN